MISTEPVTPIKSLCHFENEGLGTFMSVNALSSVERHGGPYSVDSTVCCIDHLSHQITQCAHPLIHFNLCISDDLHVQLHTVCVCVFVFCVFLS